MVANSLKASTTGVATVECDSTYAYVASNGLPTHTMMDGIVASNLQVPIAQNFFGANAWKIPLEPAIAATTTTANDGPIGVAINGVPIFNPCKQGGCQNGDTKALGELDVCNGHAGRADDYHYHAAPTCLMAGKPAGYWDTHPLGWALDGFAIFGYNDADGRVASRDDVCGGNTSAVANAPSGYSYHVTDAAPYVLSCFRGTPSPDLAGQGAKFSPIRPPPVRPFGGLGDDAGDRRRRWLPGAPVPVGPPVHQHRNRQRQLRQQPQAPIAFATRPSPVPSWRPCSRSASTPASPSAGTSSSPPAPGSPPSPPSPTAVDHGTVQAPCCWLAVRVADDDRRRVGRRTRTGENRASRDQQRRGARACRMAQTRAEDRVSICRRTLGARPAETGSVLRERAMPASRRRISAARPLGRRSSSSGRARPRKAILRRDQNLVLGDAVHQLSPKPHRASPDRSSASDREGSRTKPLAR